MPCRPCLRDHPPHDPDRLCRSAGRFNLEDATVQATYVADHGCAGTRVTDAAIAAGLLHAQNEGLPVTRNSLWLARVGRRMLSKGLEAELEYAYRKSWINAIPRLEGERLVLI